MPSPRLNEMLAEYRRRLNAGEPVLLNAKAIADYLLTLDASDFDERDRTFSRPPILPTMDLQRRAEDIRARLSD